MPRRSLVTPLIVTVLVAIATVVTFLTASSPSVSATATAPGVEGKAAPTEDVRSAAPGVIIGDGVSAREMRRLAPILRRYQREHRRVPPFVVIALGSDEQTQRPHLRERRPLTRYLPRSRRIRWLASLPGDPITQPPGWVPEPHW